MTIESDHIIHSLSGQLEGQGTSLSDAQRIATQAWQAGRQGRPIVMHFHGGLVSQKAARAGAKRLLPIYLDRGDAYPVFSVWESGLIETVKNNLGDILKDPVFKELVKKVGEWVLKEGAPAVGARGAGTAIDEALFRRDFDEWFSGQRVAPPVLDVTPDKTTGLKSAEPDEAELAVKIEVGLEMDRVFQEILAGAAVETGRASTDATRGTGLQAAPVQTLADDAALDQMFGRSKVGPSTTKGAVSWIAVARFVAKVAIAVIKRLFAGRDHGAYTTIVEEVLRAAYLAKVGAVIWGQMKKDTADAFEGSKGAGNAVLDVWAKKIAAGEPAPRLVLVGHSTGAVYINNWLRRSAAVVPSLRYDVVFLAPACLTDEFKETWTAHAPQIANIRIFAMQDAREKGDVLVPIIYLRSLLYFVSGVVESEVDVPVLGMQRFLQEKIFQTGFPGVDYLREYLAQLDNRAIWSLADGAGGLSSSATKHGDFDEEFKTIDSLVHIIKGGY